MKILEKLREQYRKAKDEDALYKSHKKINDFIVEKAKAVKEFKGFSSVIIDDVEKTIFDSDMFSELHKPYINARAQVYVVFLCVLNDEIEMRNKIDELDKKFALFKNPFVPEISDLQKKCIKARRLEKALLSRERE